jgi:formate dehydrogenase assembly factor FdhD
MGVPMLLSLNPASSLAVEIAKRIKSTLRKYDIVSPSRVNPLDRISPPIHI